MKIDRIDGAHPSDSELAAWVDEPAARSAAVEGHVGGCAPCRERLAELAATRAALALDPPMPSAAEFAAQRERVLDAIGAAPRASGGRIVGRLAWLVPLAAAATVAAILLVGRGADRGADPVPDAGMPTLPVVTAAREAAEEAAAVIAPEPSPDVAVIPAEPFDEEALEAALAAAEPLSPPLSVERSEAIEMEFAQLPEEAQIAVLLEMASAEFDL